jgi:phospholipase C
MGWSFEQRIRHARAATAVAIALTSSACGGSSGPSGAVGLLPARERTPLRKDSGAYISHLVIVIQENRSFDDLFAQFPGADGATEGLMKTGSGDTYVPLKKVALAEHCDFGHGYQGFLRSYDDGKMDGFGLEGNKCSGDHRAAYQYVDPADIKPYWDLAKRYVLADHLFQTQGSGSFTAHQDLIAGGTTYNADQTRTMIDYPDAAPWGCDAPPGTRTSRLFWARSKLVFRFNQGPFPCMHYVTMRDLLDAKSISWKYYSPPVQGGEGMLWNAFDAIKAVRYGPEWGTRVTDSDTKIFTDIKKHRLPAVSWVVPDRENSDHPASGSDTGPSWVADIVNAVGESSYWPGTAIVILWDDWGGFYDNVPPPFLDRWGGLGFRVPMIVVSAYAPKPQPGDYSYISHTPYEFGSILKFVETTFHLGTLGKTDARARDLLGCFDFSQAPRKFEVVKAPYSRRYFERQRPSYQPVDDQ